MRFAAPVKQSEKEDGARQEALTDQKEGILKSAPEIHVSIFSSVFTIGFDCRALVRSCHAPETLNGS